MHTGSVFYNNKSQAIRIPKAVRLPEGTERVEIEQRGDEWVIKPVAPKAFDWDAIFDGPKADPDFLADREQGEFDETD